MVLQTMLMEITQPTGLDEAIPRMVVRHRTSLTMQLPPSYYEKIKKVPGVKAVTPMNWYGGIWKDEDFKNFFARFAIDPNVFFDVFIDYKPLKPEYLEALKTERTACLMGEKLMERHGFKVGDKITIQGDIYPYDLELTIRGVFTGPQSDWMLFNLKYLDELEGKTARIGSFFVLADSPDHVPGLINTFETMFRNSDAEVKAETEKAFQLSFVEMLGNVKLLIQGLVSVVVFTILLIAASTMAMAIRERTREIAVLKTIGFTRARVMATVVAEGMVVSLLGGGLGIVGAWVLLPNPKYFMSAIAGLLVMCLVGLMALLVGLMLPEPTGPGHRGFGVGLQRILMRYGGWTALGLGVLVSAAMMAMVPPIDWFKFSGGMIAFMNVRSQTVVVAAAITLFVGVFSSLVPAWNASKVGVIEGLRTLG
ncbi:MAG: hypothetical protein K1X53_07845 [Candidatus Sumerlaeaceae bacterium]|nr:hypothetical protein [Candidatus Sumerlaeaceae bacterium]